MEKKTADLYITMLGLKANPKTFIKSHEDDFTDLYYKGFIIEIFNVIDFLDKFQVK